MKLLLKLGVDRQQSNLSIMKKIVIIIPNEYNQEKFRDTDLAYCHPNNNDCNQYSETYIPLYYFLFLPKGNSR